MADKLFKKKIALKNINKKNYLQFDSVIESEQKGIYLDYAFLTIGEYAGKKINMQMRLFDFAAFRNGIIELIALERASKAYDIEKHYTKVTQGTKTTTLFLGYIKEVKEKNNIKFYINLKEDDLKLSVSFDKYEIRALVDSMDNFIKFSENKFFNYIYSTGE